MPAINLPLQEARSNVTLPLVPSSHLRLLLHISLASASLLLGFVIRFAIQSKRDSYSPTRFANLADPGDKIHQQHYFSGIWDKSRGVSKNIGKVMSANQEPPFSQLEDTEPGQRQDGGSPRRSQDGANRADGSLGDVSGTQEEDMVMKRTLISRPPPPPPLTPPTLSTRVIRFEERRLSAAVSTMGDLDSNFFQQPNPDYTDLSSSSSSSSALPQSQASPTTPRRRSYTKMLPLGPPEPVSILEMDGSVSSFSPSSFPSSSPSLPLAPHNSFHPKEIDVQGEIISVMDDSGAGWKRHTRVYGGGVCLACMASNGEGGFYGASVRPEEKR